MADPGHPENESLGNAVHTVEGLYMGDLLAHSLAAVGPAPQVDREVYWEETKVENPGYAERIQELRESIQSAHRTRSSYPESFVASLSLRFRGVEDPAAMELLLDVWLARAATSPGYLHDNERITREGQAILTELGADGPDGSSTLGALTLSQVTEKILAGDLRLKPVVS